MCEAEGDRDFGGDAAGGEWFLDEDADAGVVCFLNDALMRVFEGVELDHECIDESASKCLAVAINRFSAETEVSNHALGFEFGKRFKCAIVLEDVRVVAVGVDEDEIELRASESRKTCVNACANGFGGEVVGGDAVFKTLADLGGDEHRIVRREQRTEALFT